MIAPRPIKRLLVANRGEIAARILSSARELDLETFAVYTDTDVGHTYNAAHAIRLQSPSSYMSVDELVSMVQKFKIDAVHPGYGFLSESADLSSRMAEINVMVVGPGAENLERTGDKLRARVLAEQCNVPVLPGLTDPTGEVERVRQFATKNGLPIMIKAVDGGGGRGIRLVRMVEELDSLVLRAIEESPSKKVFAEKAAVDDFRHVEVQIVGDGHGNVMHLWERECSIQRRYQKIVELAPSTAQDRSVVAPLIESAVRMAKRIRYSSLGTFEFLLNPQTGEYYFLEINPRIQVEHTITESICNIDLVQVQLRLAQGASLKEAGLADIDNSQRPGMYSIQLRVTAEDPEKDYSLSIGRIQSFRFPAGNGVRVDTALVQNTSAVVSANFDSVIAKLIITARTWDDVIAKARRALQDTEIVGVRNNLALLRAIVEHRDFENGRCDTRWLKSSHKELLEKSREYSRKKDALHGLSLTQSANMLASSSASASSMLFRKDDAWSIALRPQGKGEDAGTASKQHLQLTKVLRNDFPSSFSADILYTMPGRSPSAFTMEIQSTSSSAAAASSQHRQGNRSDPSHIIVPFSGKLVEVLVDVGDTVSKDDVICVIKQMKMELEVRSSRRGLCTWVTSAEDDEDVAEGMLAAIVEDEDHVQAKL